MIEASVRRWSRYGKDRIYVTARDGTQLGWHDLLTGETRCTHTAGADLLAATVATWRQRAGMVPAPRSAPDLAPLVAGPVPTCGDDLRGRLPGDAVADKLDELDRRRDTLLASAARARAEVAELKSRDRELRRALPTIRLLAAVLGMHTAERREIRLRIGLARREARSTSRAARPALAAVADERRSWQLGFEGEITVARALEDVVRRDARWRLVHAVPVGSGGSDIDHVVIGPGGVFTLNTKHHRGANVFAAHDALLVNGTRHPYVRNARFEARRAERYLGAALRTRVAVTGAIVVVGAQRLTVRAQPDGVRVLDVHDLGRWLLRRPDVLSQESIARIYEVAVRGATWR